MLRPDSPALVLAPMEGITDAPMRALWGETRCFTYAVTEFLRVNNDPLTERSLLRDAPELAHGSKTPSGLPVQIQLLGGDPGRLAESAVRAVELGALGIDLNFGCPARTVNRHDGGASLLRHPERLRAIVRAVRDAVPSQIPISAKLRLGWDSVDEIDKNAAMAAEGGAHWLTLHGRTRMQGYAPPVCWQSIGRVQRALGLPIIANGDIWTLDDFRRCRDITGCHHFMIGRSALANPLLPYYIATELGLPCGAAPDALDWNAWFRRLCHWTGFYEQLIPNRTLLRLKQWANFARLHGEFAAFDLVKRTATIESFFDSLGTELTNSVS